MGHGSISPISLGNAACSVTARHGLLPPASNRWSRGRRDLAYRFAVGMALAAAFLLVWMNLAVGVIGSEDNPANLMYFGVLAIGFLGAIIAELRPQGMARDVVRDGARSGVGPRDRADHLVRPPVERREVLTLNGFFVVLFVGSALLFRLRRAGSPQYHLGVASAVVQAKAAAGDKGVQVDDHRCRSVRAPGP